MRQPFLHPLWRVRWLSYCKRFADVARARRGHRVALAGSAALIVALVSLARWAGTSGLTQRAADAPLVPTILVFALVYLIARAVATTSERDMRFGMTAALPVTDAVRRRTSLVFAVLAGGLLRLVVGLPFAFGAGDIPASFDIAALLGAVLAWLTTRRWSTAQRVRNNPALHQVPKLFFANRTPTSRAVPHLPLWQRLRATAHWRTTGRAWQLGAIALLLPRNAGIYVLVMLVILGTMLWWTVMLRAAVSVVLDARALLAALHVDHGRLMRESSRYPAMGSAIAALVVVAVIGAVQ